MSFPPTRNPPLSVRPRSVLVKLPHGRSAPSPLKPLWRYTSKLLLLLDNLVAPPNPASSNLSPTINTLRVNTDCESLRSLETLQRVDILPLRLRLTRKQLRSSWLVLLFSRRRLMILRTSCDGSIECLLDCVRNSQSTEKRIRLRSNFHQTSRYTLNSCST